MATYPMLKPLLNSYEDIVSSFAEFLTVAVHIILYERNLYPRTSYLNARKYNYPVRQSRHPGVCRWIQDAVNAVEKEMIKGTVVTISLLFYSESSYEALERFVFSPLIPSPQSFMSVAAEADIREPANVEPDSSPPRSSPFRSSPTPTPETPFRGISSTDITEQYRGILSRLSPLPSNLLPLPSGASYTILIETTARDGAPIGNPQPWIPAEARDGRSATASEETSSDSGHNQSKHLPQTQIHGIRSLRAGTGPNLYTMECFVEETQRKAHLLDEQRQKAADEAMIKKVERTREFADLKREIEKTVRRGEVVGEQAREEQEEEDESSGLLGKASSSEGTTDSSAPNRSGQLP